MPIAVLQQLGRLHPHDVTVLPLRNDVAEPHVQPECLAQRTLKRRFDAGKVREAASSTTSSGWQAPAP